MPKTEPNTIIAMDNPTIQTDVAQILAEIKEELKTTNNRLSKIEIAQAEIKTKVENVEKEISEVKGSQSKQVWALIGIVFSAVGILGKIVFFPPH
jgi:predicted  nucleic acid-binding Zn-ribbon protein